MKYKITIITIYSVLLFMTPAKQIISQVGIDAYILMAADSNPSVQAKYYEFLSVAEKINQSGSIPDPTLSVAYGLSPVETRLGAQEAKISVTQMFPWFGTSRAKKETYTYNAESKWEQYQASRSKVMLDVKLAWYALYENKKKIAYTNQMIELLEIIEDLVFSKYENNQTGMVNVLQIQIEVDELVDRKLQFEEKHRSLETTFNLLLNNPSDEKILIPDTLFTSKDPAIYLIDSMLENNHEIKALKYRYLGSEEMKNVSKLNGNPSFGIGLDYSIISKRTDMDVPDNGRDVIMPMASLKLPIYRKKYKSAVMENTMNSEGIKHTIRQVENRLIMDYQNATESYSDAHRKAILYLGQIEKAKQALQLLLTDSETGKIQFENILKMEQMLIRYKLLYEGANKRKLNAIATLEYLVSN